jgi:hypothetical protein
LRKFDYATALPKDISFTPGFSRVLWQGSCSETVLNGFPVRTQETVETVPCLHDKLNTRLKPGENEMS